MRLAVKHHGAEGLPVVLLHGFPLHGAMWDHVVQTLVDDGVRVIVPDLPGHGGSPVDHAANMESMAAAVLAAVPGPLAVAGFSMGGYVALAMARAAPERIRGLALVDTRTGADDAVARAGRARTITTLQSQGMAALAEGMMPRLLAATTRQRAPHVEDAVRAMILSNRVEGAVAALQAMADRRDQSSLLAHLDVPATVIVGAEDAITPPDEAHLMAEAMPDATLHVVPDAAHLVPMEQPAICADALRTWAQRL